MVVRKARRDRDRQIVRSRGVGNLAATGSLANQLILLTCEQPTVDARARAAAVEIVLESAVSAVIVAASTSVAATGKR